jgi:hypothetical protein
MIYQNYQDIARRAVAAATFLLLPMGLVAISTSRAMAGPNLVTNGDFESGNTGFTSDYTYWNGGNSGSGPGGFQIGNNAQNDNNLWTDPETPGANNYMYVDGSPTATDSFFTQNITNGIIAGHTYVISADFASLYDNQPELSIQNGNTTISPTYNVTNVGSWKSYSFDWTATSNALDLKMVDQDTVASGNDFAVDNISVRAVPEASTVVLFGLLAVGGLIVLRKRSPKTIA